MRQRILFPCMSLRICRVDRPADMALRPHVRMKGRNYRFVLALSPDVFTTGGTIVSRIASGGLLNSPWGMAIAPSTFDSFAGDLLVGNFGDGRINAFRLLDGKFRGQLKMHGKTTLIPGLWALVT